MKVLYDTHALIWAVDDPARIPGTAFGVMRDPKTTRLLSAATIWEVAIKVAIGKLILSLPYRSWMNQASSVQRMITLPIELDHADRLLTLPMHHRDPFDRMLVVQALVEGVPVISADTQFDAYGITRIWT